MTTIIKLVHKKGATSGSDRMVKNNVDQQPTKLKPKVLRLNVEEVETIILALKSLANILAGDEDIQHPLEHEQLRASVEALRQKTEKLFE